MSWTFFGKTGRWSPHRKVAPLRQRFQKAHRLHGCVPRRFTESNRLLPSCIGTDHKGLVLQQALLQPSFFPAHSFIRPDERSFRFGIWRRYPCYTQTDAQGHCLIMAGEPGVFNSVPDLLGDVLRASRITSVKNSNQFLPSVTSEKVGFPQSRLDAASNFLEAFVTSLMPAIAINFLKMIAVYQYNTKLFRNQPILS